MKISNWSPFLLNFLFQALLVLILLFPGCRENGIIPPIKQSLELVADEVVTTHAYFKLHYSTTDSITVQIKRNGSVIIPTLSIRSDAAFEDTLLEPATSYKYTAQRIDNGDQSQIVEIMTLPATSHDFTWQTTQFGGDAGSCIFRSVTVVNDTLIYAVGDIVIKDSSPEGYHPYNAARWNGKKWELLEIPVPDWGEAVGIYPLHTVIAFAPNNVWFCSNASLIQWDGIRFTRKAFFALSLPFNNQVSCMWGRAPDDIYCGGAYGALFHYRSGAWNKIDLGTTLIHVNDLCGIETADSSRGPLYASLLSDPFMPSQSTKLLRVTSDTKVDSLTWKSNWLISTLWTSNGKTFYLGGGPMFFTYRNGIMKEKMLLNYVCQIRGNGQNDIIAVGDFGGIGHFNGVDWKRYMDVPLLDGWYTAVSIKGNTMAAVGFTGASAVITIGQRK